VAAGPLLSKAGLTLEEIRDPARRIKVGDQIRFLNLAARALKDEFLGFNLAMQVDFRELGLFYYVLASSANLKEALERGTHYSEIVNEGVTQELHSRNHHRVLVRYHGVSRHLDRHQIEFWMAALVRMCRELSGHRIVPKHVRFVHIRHGDHARFARIFGDDVKFGASVDEIVLRWISSRYLLSVLTLISTSCWSNIANKLWPIVREKLAHSSHTSKMPSFPCCRTARPR